MNLDEIVSRFENPKRSGNGYMVTCPVHADSNQSLSISAGDGGRIVMKCFGGCDTKDILAARGLSMKDLFNDSRMSRPKRKVVAHYLYEDAGGRPLLRVVRTDPKGFFRETPDGRGGWTPGGSGNTAALYRWPRLRQAAQEGRPRCWIVEGEKDADNMAGLGPEVVVTTALGGSTKWRDEYAAEFVGFGEVAIIADNDGEGNRHKGQRYAIKVRESLRNAGVENVHAYTLPAQIDGRRVKDASDAISAGWKLADFENWAEVAADLNADDYQDGGAEHVEELAAAIAKAVLRERQLTDGHLKQEHEAEIVSRVGVKWLLDHGAFFIDEESYDISGTYYFYRPEKRLFYIGDKVDSPLYFAAWLSARSGYPRISRVFRQFFADCQTVATATDKTTLFKPCRYWERRNGNVYISCGEGRMCRICPGSDDGADAGSIEIVDNGTDGVLFLRNFTLLSWELVDFEASKSPLECRVFRDMALETPADDGGYGDGQWLLLFWMLLLPFNLTHKPPLLLCGTVGSGKTRAAVGVSELFGLPSGRIMPVRDDGEESFWTAANQGGVLVLDNVDTKTKWIADAVAAASTGSGNLARKLYTSNDVVVHAPRAALVFTSSNPYFAADPGLADRLEVVRLERNDRETADDALSEDMSANRNACMTYICQVVFGALQSKADPPANFNRRHPDWSKWAWRCGEAMGVADIAARVLAAAEADKTELFLENDSGFSGELVKFVTVRGGFDGTSSELLEALKSSAEAEGRKFAFSNARSFGKKLSANWPFYKSFLKARKTMVHKVAHYRFSPPETGGEVAESSADTAEAGGIYQPELNA